MSDTQTMNDVDYYADYSGPQATPIAVRDATRQSGTPQRGQAPPSTSTAPESKVRQTVDVSQLMMAFARAQMAFPVIAKNKTANIEKGATKYSYRYADLADVQQAINPALKENGLAFMSIPTRGQLVGRLIHEPTGQWIEGDLAIVPPDTRGGVQALGSALTYERRYLFAAMLNLVLDEDDDGAEAQAATYASRGVVPVPGGLAKFVAELAADEESDTRVELIERMVAQREPAAVQVAALKMFDALRPAPKAEAGNK